MSFYATSRRLGAETVDDLEAGDCHRARSLGDSVELGSGPSLLTERKTALKSPIPSSAAEVSPAAAKQQH
jgi:hypothetical protein